MFLVVGGISVLRRYRLQGGGETKKKGSILVPWYFHGGNERHMPATSRQLIAVPRYSARTNGRPLLRGVTVYPFGVSPVTQKETRDQRPDHARYSDLRPDHLFAETGTTTRHSISPPTHARSGVTLSDEAPGTPVTLTLK